MILIILYIFSIHFNDENGNDHNWQFIAPEGTHWGELFGNDELTEVEDDYGGPNFPGLTRGDMGQVAVSIDEYVYYIQTNDLDDGSWITQELNNVIMDDTTYEMDFIV